MDTVHILKFGGSISSFDQSQVAYFKNGAYFALSRITSTSRKLLKYIKKILQLLICIREVILLVVFLILIIKRLVGKLIFYSIVIRSVVIIFTFLFASRRSSSTFSEKTCTSWSVTSCIPAIRHVPPDSQHLIPTGQHFFICLLHKLILRCADVD